MAQPAWLSGPDQIQRRNRPLKRGRWAALERVGLRGADVEGQLGVSSVVRRLSFVAKVALM